MFQSSLYLLNLIFIAKLIFAQLTNLFVRKNRILLHIDSLLTFLHFDSFELKNAEFRDGAF